MSILPSAQYGLASYILLKKTMLVWAVFAMSMGHETLVHIFDCQEKANMYCKRKASREGLQYDTATGRWQQGNVWLCVTRWQVE
jgi:hypothetical protein